MRTLTATGHGTAHVEPDAADVRVAAVARAAGVSDALAGVDAALRLAAATAKEFTDAAEISSAGLSVWPHLDHEGRPAGFEARHTLAIRCSDLAAAGALVGALAERVGDRLVVESVSLVVADRQPAEDQAREAAYADARRRATHLAELAGERLGLVVSATEGRLSDHVVTEQALGNRSALDISFEGGRQAVSTSVTATFSIEE